MQTAQHKKLYENVLSSGQSPQSLMKALSSVLRLAIGDHSHFGFLLYNINWFEEPYLNHISVLEKALRLYRGRGKQSEKVAYNILTDGMWSSAASLKVCECLINLIKPGFDHKLLKQSLRQNYPHKVVELQMQQNYLRSLLYLYLRLDEIRFDILEIIILQLASFDTELCTEDLHDTKIFASDSEIRVARSKPSQNAQTAKFDNLISILMEELSTKPQANKEGKLFKELLLIFKNDLVLVEQTQYVQFILYYFAEVDKKEAKNFVTFLLCEILQKIQSKAHRKVLVSLTNYLASYVSRSTSLPSSYINKTVANLIKLTNESLNARTLNPREEEKPECVNLGKTFEDNFDILLLLQSVLWIWTARHQCRDHNYEELKNLLDRCDKQIYYKYFIHHDLLKKSKIVDLAENVTNYRCLEVLDKFNPPHLKRLNMFIGNLIKPYEPENSKLKIEAIKSQVKYENIIEGLPSKRTKSEKRQSNETTI